jgi:hypothetical protein
LARWQGRDRFSPVSRVFEQQLDSLDEVGFASSIVALADYVQLKAAGHVPGAFLVDCSCQTHADNVALAVRGGAVGREALGACQRPTVSSSLVRVENPHESRASSGSAREHPLGRFTRRVPQLVGMRVG